MVENENFKYFNDFIKEIIFFNHLIDNVQERIKYYENQISNIEKEIAWNKIQKNIDFNEYIKALKEEIIEVKNKRVSYLPEIKKWEEKYNITYPDLPFSVKYDTIPDDDNDVEWNFGNNVVKTKIFNGNTELTQDELDELDELKNDFTEYAKELAINKVLEIIIEKENNNISIEKWEVNTFSLFLFFLKKGNYEDCITKKQLEKELMKKYDYSLGLSALNNTIISINKKKEKGPLTIINIIKVMPHLVEYPLSLIKASEMLIELCRKQKTPS